MARLCDNCERASNRAVSRSHSNIATKRQQFANLQYRRIAGMRVRLCTRCIKTFRREMDAMTAGK